MTDDLVKRLRVVVGPQVNRDVTPFVSVKCSLIDEAATRIEQLEAALERIAQHDLQAIALDALRPGERAALEGKDAST